MLSTACKNIISPNLSPPPSSSPLKQITSSNKILIPRAIATPSPHRINHAPQAPTHTSVTLEDDSMAAYWDYQFLFVSQRSETGSQPINLRVIEGAIPSDFPQGTYYLTGPGLFTDDYGSTVHPLDGHGYLRAFTFDGNKDVEFMAKYVKTDAQVEEHDPITDTWRFTHRGPFSVLKNGKRFGNTKVMKNVANTNVLKWGGKLLCLWEGGEPYEIESETLDTVGKFDMIKIDDCDQTKLLEGKYNNNDAVTLDMDIWGLAARLLKPILHGIFNMPAKRLLSHYKLDAQRNRLLTMSCNAEDMLLPRSNFVFYEFDSNFKLLQKREFEISDHLMLHDWAFTDSYYILFSNRVKLDVVGSIGAVCGLSPMISALKVNPSKSTSPIYLLPRFPNDGNRRDWRVPIEVPSQLWLQHVGNSFEVKDYEDGSLEIQIHACACSYQWFNFPKMFGYDWQSGKLDPSMMNLKEELLPRLVQVSIDIDANENIEKCRVESMNQWTKTSDFPIVNPKLSGKKSSFIYAATSSGSRRSLPLFPFDSIIKLNLLDKSTKTWSVGRRRFIGEPIFVPKGVQEDDGYLLVVEYAVAIQMCYLVVLDAKKIGEADAMVARLEDGRANALYSTPSIYTDAKYAANEAWPLKTDDFFPYADDVNAYWTGYFTSRPSLKGYAARQLEFFQGRSKAGLNTESLADALALAQHHDAVTSREKQHVAYDYAERLAIGYTEAEKVVAKSLGCIAESSSKTGSGSQVSSLYSYCPASEIALSNGKSPAARQLEFFRGISKAGPNTESLADALALAQHHVAVTAKMVRTRWNRYDDPMVAAHGSSN
ncbi:hypothetical protein ACFE04_018099 [Oxalis oulophora]